MQLKMDIYLQEIWYGRNVSCWHESCETSLQVYLRIKYIKLHLNPIILRIYFNTSATMSVSYLNRYLKQYIYTVDLPTQATWGDNIKILYLQI